MNKFHIRKYLLLGLFFCCILTVKSQAFYTGEIQYKDIHIYRQDDKLFIQFNVDLNALQLPRQLVISHVPVLQAEDMSIEYIFDPILVAGTIRNKVVQRQKDFYLPDGSAPLLYIVHKNRPTSLYPVLLTVPYEEWMRHARLTCWEQVSGCANCGPNDAQLTLLDKILPPVHIPAFELQYVMPEAEPIKHRSETYAAHLNFKVGRHELLRDFENNATIFREVDQKVTEISKDKNLTIQSMQVIGYASPEGNYNSNFELSKKRTHSFVDYLLSAHHLPQSIIKLDWKGEDWDGLAQSVKSSFLPDRERIIRIIQENENVSIRKEQLHRLNGGQTYRTLLNQYYPPLRRIEYTFSYVARAFDIEEAKEIIKTKPQHLSLNEMFLVANTYSKGSEEFNRIFDIAVRLFPTDEVAKSNAAVQEIEMGALDKAIERLQTIHTSEAYNNLGIAYVKKENYDQAKNYFQKAINQGNVIAQKNMQELDLYLESK